MMKDNIKIEYDIDESALDIILKYNIKNVIIVDSKKAYKVSTLLCINIDNPNYSFICSSKLMDSLIERGILKCDNRTYIGTIGRCNIKRRDKYINNYYKDNIDNITLRTLKPHFNIIKVNNEYIITGLKIPEVYVNEKYELTVPSCVKYIVLGDLEVNRYVYDDCNKPVHDKYGYGAVTYIDTQDAKIVNVRNGIDRNMRDVI